MCQAIVDFAFERLVLFFEFRKVRLHRHAECLLNLCPRWIKPSSDSPQVRNYTRLRAAANPAEAIDRWLFFRRLERRCGKRDNSGAVAEPDPGIKQTSGGDERQR